MNNNSIEPVYEKPDYNIEIYQDYKLVANASNINFISNQKLAPIYVCEKDLDNIRSKKGHVWSIIFNSINKETFCNIPFTIRIVDSTEEMFLLGVEFAGKENLKDIEINKRYILIARAVVGWRKKSHHENFKLSMG